MAGSRIVFRAPEALPEEDRVLARSGCPPARRGRFGAEAREAIERLSGLAAPEALVTTKVVESMDGEGIRAEDISISSSSLARFMKGADRLSVFLVTIGPRPETEAGRLQKEGFQTRAFFLDAAASCMVEKVARELHGRLALDFQDFRSTARFAPGFGDFPLSFQEDIMNILDGRSIGVSLRRDSFSLKPVKSGTGVIGWISRTS